VSALIVVEQPTPSPTIANESERPLAVVGAPLSPVISEYTSAWLSMVIVWDAKSPVVWIPVPPAIVNVLVVLGACKVSPASDWISA